MYIDQRQNGDELFKNQKQLDEIEVFIDENGIEGTLE